MVRDPSVIDPSLSDPDLANSDLGHGDGAAKRAGGRVTAHSMPTPTRAPKSGWPLATDGDDLSLAEVHASIAVPRGGSWLKRFVAFSGPGYLISVGYMDPGNWATDIAGGSRFGYTLLFVIMLSNLMAILLQSLALKLGVATERDLAQLCHESYGKKASLFLWLGAEIAIAACDLAEVI